MIEVLQASIGGLFQVFTATTFSLMVVGIAIGFTVGILPGLGGPVTLALMLPFIFRMEATEAFAFLLGMSSVTATTGDITSILFGVPGESITASTIVDGHPMAKKGEAGRALGAALMSSLVGAIFGAFSLALAIPIVRPLVLFITSPEFFMLALLGITFVASLSGGAVLKGLITGGIGLMLATVGLDAISGIQRFTFGNLYLWDGIRLVPVTLGLFAIPEIIDLGIKGTSIAETQVGKLGGVMEGVKDTFRHWRLVLRCSALGTYIGVIPGMGGGVSQWIAYAHAVQSSPDKDRFGKGAVEGVLGPGAANNSTLGGALVPTIAFGVPGSVTMAILLGAFIIQGLVPGPPMLIPESQGGHLTLTFSFVWILVVTNIITVTICFLFLNQLTKITHVRGSLIIPFILLLVYLGAFAEKNAFEDMGVVLVFGVLGWIMVQLDFQRPPLILGLVLGGLAENNLFLATDNYGLAWLFRPSVLFFLLLILAAVFHPVLVPVINKLFRWKRKPLPAQVPEAVYAPVKPAQLPKWYPLFSLFIVVVVALALWESGGWKFRARLFPWVIGFPLVTIALIQLGRDIRELAKVVKKRVEALTEKKAAEAATVRRRTVRIAGWILGFFAMIWLLGFPVAVPLCTFFYVKVGGAEKWPISLSLAAVSWLFFYGLFIYLLYIPFPEGLLFSWLNS
jgi:TctA family transporter